MPVSFNRLGQAFAGEAAALAVVGRDEADVVVALQSRVDDDDRDPAAAPRRRPAATSAASSSGASTMPETPRLTKPFDLRHLRVAIVLAQRSAPDDRRRPAPRRPCSAPAWMLCQNTCDVPFGMTAIVSAPGAAARIRWPASRPARRAARRRRRQKQASASALMPRSIVPPRRMPTSAFRLKASYTRRARLRRLRFPEIVDRRRTCRTRCKQSLAVPPSICSRSSANTRRSRRARGRSRPRIRRGHVQTGQSEPIISRDGPNAVERDVEVRSELPGRPRAPVGFGHQPRQLAPDVGQAPPAREVAPPLGRIRSPRMSGLPR